MCLSLINVSKNCAFCWNYTFQIELYQTECPAEVKATVRGKVLVRIIECDRHVANLLSVSACGYTYICMCMCVCVGTNLKASAYCLTFVYAQTHSQFEIQSEQCEDNVALCVVLFVCLNDFFCGIDNSMWQRAEAVYVLHIQNSLTVALAYVANVVRHKRLGGFLAN